MLSLSYISISNFQIVILAADGSVWMMGTSDDDRNGYCEPVRVESDYHLSAPSLHNPT